MAVKMKQQVHSSESRMTECFKTQWLVAYHSAVEVPEDLSVSGIAMPPVHSQHSSAPVCHSLYIPSLSTPPLSHQVQKTRTLADADGG